MMVLSHAFWMRITIPNTSKQSRTDELLEKGKDSENVGAQQRNKVVQVVETNKDGKAGEEKFNTERPYVQ